MRIVVHVVDDDASFRRAIARLLLAAGYEVAVYESATELLQRLPDDPGRGCILLDVQIPDISGPDLQDILARRGSSLPIIFLTGRGDIATSVRAIKAGAEDFLTKPVSKDTLLFTIERALTRSETAQQQRDQLNASRSLVAALTPREHEVFELVVRGKLNKQIAFALGTSERTVKAHRHKVMEKIGVQSVAELVLIAERTGILAVADSKGAGGD